jgi:hypothetical protein
VPVYLFSSLSLSPSPSPSPSLQTPKVAKIQAAWPSKNPFQVPLTPSTQVAHVLKQFSEDISPGSQNEEGCEDQDSLLPE